jgi:F-type H+-transporting ATPase subunit gamma
MTMQADAIARRLATVHQLEEVVIAMRGIASSRVHEAEQSLEAVRAHTKTLGEAIGQALALINRSGPSGRDSQLGKQVIILLTAEEGFVGGFCDSALDAAEGELRAAADREAELMITGSRGATLAKERGMVVTASTRMPLHLREVVPLANKLTDELFRRVAVGDVVRITLLHGAPGKEVSKKFQSATLIPFDYSRFRTKPQLIPPIITTPPERLLNMLAEEYVFAELCEALTLGFAAENEARLNAMMSATENVRRSAEELTNAYRQSRQRVITEEVIELAESSLPPHARRALTGDAAG